MIKKELDMKNNNGPIIIIYGVSGSGKSTVGQLVADKLSLPFYDADDFHPTANIEKMTAGTPLNDEDRLPWLQAINKKMREVSKQEGGVFACSALKELYREILRKELTRNHYWFLLNGSFKLVRERMSKRNHFMPPALLQSQFDTLEIPDYGTILDISDSVTVLVKHISEQVT